MATDDYSSIKSGTMGLAILFAAIAYLISGAIYRLFFHPLASFPGPNLAALTTWYEGYIDITTKGRFTWHLAKLHDRYGPIVRIGPNEVHILDSSYYNTLYLQRNKLQKFEYFYAMLGNPETVFATVDRDLHKMRRGASSPFLSAKAVMAFTPRVQMYTERLCARMDQRGKSGEPIPLFFAYRCLTVDIIAEYLFGKDLGLLDRPDWGRSFYEARRALWELTPLTRQLPWMPKLMEALPRSVVGAMNPGALEVLGMQDLMGELTKEILSGDDTQKIVAHGHETDKKSTMVWYLANSDDLPPEEKTFDRVRIEANNVMAAGFETTGGTLAHMTYLILSDKAVHRRLYADLKRAIPDAKNMPPWQQLENIPYLWAVVRETLRISVGAYSRLSRSNKDEAMRYGHWVIPAGTGIGMSALYIAHDPEIFTDPLEFLPDRWLEPGAKERLEPYLTAFGKGSRMCVGMNLAYAELYGVIATIIRRYPDIRLWETRAEDCEAAHDYFAGMWRYSKDRAGLQVKLR